MKIPATCGLLFATLLTGCDQDASQDIEAAALEAQALRTYCDNGQCVDIVPGDGYSASANNGRVAISDASGIRMVYDIDGGSIAFASWAKTSWTTVDCHGEVLSTFATAEGVEAVVVDDFEFDIVDGKDLVATVSSQLDAHPEREQYPPCCY